MGVWDGWDYVAANDALAHLNDLFTSRRCAVSVREHVGRRDLSPHRGKLSVNVSHSLFIVRSQFL